MRLSIRVVSKFNSRKIGAGAGNGAGAAAGAGGKYVGAGAGAEIGKDCCSSVDWDLIIAYLVKMNKSLAILIGKHYNINLFL